MADLFKQQGIEVETGKDLFSGTDVKPPSIEERNTNALMDVVELKPIGEQRDITDTTFTEITEVDKQAAIQAEQFDNLAKSRFTQEQIDEWKNNPIGFTEANDFLSYQDVLPLGGVSKAVDVLGIKDIAERQSKGEDLSDGDQQRLNEFIDKTVEMRTRGFSFGGSVAYYGSQLPAFMTEFALTGGVGKMAANATTKAINKMATSSVLTKASSTIANATARTAAMPGLYAPKYAERRMNDFMAVTDKGELLFQESKESPASSALKAFAYTGAEVASEMTGAAILKGVKYVADPLVGKFKTPLIDGVSKIPVKIRQNLYNAYKKIKPNAQVSKVFSRAGWHGMIGELGEEQVNRILTESLNLSLEENYTMEQFLDGIVPSVDQLMLEASLISIVGGAKTGASMAMNALQRKGQTPVQSQKDIDNLSATEQEALSEAEFPLPASGFGVLLPTMDIMKTQNVSLNTEDKTPSGDFIKQDYLTDSEGRLKAVFHGTPDVREILKSGFATSHLRGDAFFFTDKKTVASTYADDARAFDFQNAEPSVIAVNLKLGKTKVIDGKGQKWEKTEDQVNEAKKAGFDSILIKNTRDEYNDINTGGEASNVYVVFDKGQIKDAGQRVKGFENKDIGDLSVLGKPDDFISENLSVSDIDPEIIEPYIDDARSIVEEDFFDEIQAGTADFQEIEKIVNEVAIELAEGDGVDVRRKGNLVATFKSIDNLNLGVTESQIEAIEKVDPPAINEEESGFNKFYRQWVNSLQPIEDLSNKAIAQNIDIPRGEDPKLLARTYAGAVGITRQNLQVETFILNKEGNIEKTGKALKAITDDWDNSIAHIEGSRDQREIDIDDYLVARRYLEDLKDREDVEVSEKQSLDSAETMTRLGQKYGDEFEFFDTYAQEVYEFQRNILKNLVAAGNMSQETFDDIVKNNPNYVPFKRVMDEESFIGGTGKSGVFTDARASKVIKKIKGSTRDVKNTIGSIISNTADIIDLSYKNRVAKSIADMSKYMPEYVQEVKPLFEKVMVKGKQESIPSRQAPKGTITVFEDGKRKFYKVSPPILEAVNQLQPVTLGFMSKIFTLPATVLRAGATLNPEFWIRNVLRDQSTGLIQSKVRPTPIDMVKGLFSVMGNGKLYNDWMSSGGSFNSYMETTDKGIEKAYNELLRPQGKLGRYLRNPINIPADISGVLEQATRVGIFTKAKKKGLTDIEAAYEAREGTLDFARGGSYAKAINRAIAFFNVGVQGSDKLFRIFKENPVGTTFWGMSTITIPSVILTGYYLYEAPEEERAEYLEIPQWQKDMFWVFKMDGEWKRYPKPFSLGYLFGSVPERAMHWGYEGDKPEVKNMYLETVKGLVGAVSPVYDPSAMIAPAFKVAIENVTNYNFFSGRSIYPEWMDKLEPEQRKNKFTTDTATFIGENLGVSPAKVDNTIRGVLAGSGKYVTDAGDFILRSVKEWNGEKLAEKPITASDVPLIKAFAVRRPSGYRAASTQVFMDKWHEVKQKNATYNRLTGKDKSEYLQKNRKSIQLYRGLRQFNKQIRTIGKQMDTVYDDKRMSSERKVEKINQFEDAILKVARSANKLIKSQEKIK